MKEKALAYNQGQGVHASQPVKFMRSESSAGQSGCNQSCCLISSLQGVLHFKASGDDIILSNSHPLLHIYPTYPRVGYFRTISKDTIGIISYIYQGVSKSGTKRSLGHLLHLNDVLEVLLDLEHHLLSLLMCRLFV